MIQVLGIEEAVGFPLAHDITEIRSGEFKGPAFQRGYILKDNDLDHLRRLGKNHLFVLKPGVDEMHEDDAAKALADALCGPGVGWSGEPEEGKVSLKAAHDGLLKVDTDALLQFNELGDIMCATMHTNTYVEAGAKVASTRAIPLLIPRHRIEAAEAAARSAGDGVLKVLPLKQVGVGVMITGNEVFHGRIEDKFEPIIRKKVTAFGGSVMDVKFLPDDDQIIADAALGLIERGVDILITTGGMSVDPDDRTRFALMKAGARDMIYGAAVLPGSMFMIADLKGVPVLGIPSCGMYASTTIFDLIYARVLAGDNITRKDVAMLGHGGLCLKCDECVYPRCPFGK
ncbi:MAG: molybdopterin-binding protein [Deltaproteobacteria bacterium]|nr:molybdopterin-binding protein [Deltaproteobacteria bacterium]